MKIDSKFAWPRNKQLQYVVGRVSRPSFDLK